jgi:hypothetical protein
MDLARLCCFALQPGASDAVKTGHPPTGKFGPGRHSTRDDVQKNKILADGSALFYLLELQKCH